MMSACALGSNPGLRLPSSALLQQPQEPALGLQSLLTALGDLGVSATVQMQHASDAQLDGSILDDEGRRHLLEDAAVHRSSEVELALKRGGPPRA